MATKAANKKDLEKLRDLLPQGVNPRDTVWDCHGTWVMYHRYIEQIAAHNQVSIVDLDLCNVGEKNAVVKCEVEAGDRKIITFGEASPANCKNAYPVAMAEKRAVDRAVLKAVLIHGTIYSENEDETFAASPPPAPAKPAPEKKPAAKKSNAAQTDNAVVQLMADADISADMQERPAVRQGAIQAASANTTDKLRSEWRMFKKNVSASTEEAAEVDKIFKCKAENLKEV